MKNVLLFSIFSAFPALLAAQSGNQQYTDGGSSDLFILLILIFLLFVIVTAVAYLLIKIKNVHKAVLHINERINMFGSTDNSETNNSKTEKAGDSKGVGLSDVADKIEEINNLLMYDKKNNMSWNFMLAEKINQLTQNLGNLSSSAGRKENNFDPAILKSELSDLKESLDQIKQELSKLNESSIRNNQLKPKL